MDTNREGIHGDFYNGMLESESPISKLLSVDLWLRIEFRLNITNDRFVLFFQTDFGDIFDDEDLA